MRQQNRPDTRGYVPEYLITWLKLLDVLPTTSTRPAMSAPSIVFFGFRSPDTRRSKGWITSQEMQVSCIYGYRVKARTSSSLGVEFSTSFSSRTSGAPYFIHAIAFIWVSFLGPSPFCAWQSRGNLSISLACGGGLGGC